jgi:hypothetical protein
MMSVAHEAFDMPGRRERVRGNAAPGIPGCFLRTIRSSTG